MKPEKVIGTFYTAGEFSVKKTDTAYFFIFDYVLSSYSKFGSVASNVMKNFIFLYLQQKDVQRSLFS